MSKRTSLSVLVVLAASGALIAGCSSSNSTGSVTTPTTAASAPAASTASADAISAADCTIIARVSSGAIATLMPLQSETPAKAEASMKAYLATLSADENQLASAKGKATLGAFITAMGKTLTQSTAQSTTTVSTAVSNLATACA